MQSRATIVAVFGAALAVGSLVVDHRAAALMTKATTPPPSSGCTACNRGTLPSLDLPLFDRMATARKVFLDVVVRDGASQSDISLIGVMAADHNTLDRRYVALWCLETAANLSRHYGRSAEPGRSSFEIVRGLCEDDDPVVSQEASRLYALLENK